MFSQSTVTDLINLYYNVCDKWFNYLPKNCTPTQVAEYRTNIVNTIYLIVYNRMPKGNDTFKLKMLLNNDIISKRLSASEIIKRLKVKNG
jgi:hypothetical protein